MKCKITFPSPIFNSAVLLSIFQSYRNKRCFLSLCPRLEDVLKVLHFQATLVQKFPIYICFIMLKFLVNILKMFLSKDLNLDMHSNLFQPIANFRCIFLHCVFNLSKDMKLADDLMLICFTHDNPRLSVGQSLHSC